MTPPLKTSQRFHPSVDAIEEQLDRILASKDFKTTERICHFLRFIVEEALAGRGDQLKGYTVATAVYGRKKDFDPAQDPVVRTQAGRLRQALERYYLVAGSHDSIVIEVPKGRYIPKFTHRPPRPESPPATPQEKAWQDAAVSVLPLENLTGDLDKNFLTMGLAEDLLTELNRYEDLIVIPCYRMASKIGPLDVDQFCRESGTRFYLAGSVRSDAETTKIAMHLVDGMTGRQIWAQGFKISLEAAHFIKTQEEIAHQVVAAIASEYGIIARRLTDESRKKAPSDLSTYEAMLRYYAYQITPSPEASPACFEALHRAAEREPNFGPVWSALAVLFCQMYAFGAPGFDDPLNIGLAHAQQGVALEPGRQSSLLILAYATLLSNDLESFKDKAAAALELNPSNPYATGTLGYQMVLAGDFEKGRELLDSSMELNPFHPHWFNHGVYLDCFRMGDFHGAAESISGFEEVGFWHPALLVSALGKQGLKHEAAPHLRKLLATKPDFPERAKELLSRSLKVPDLVTEILDGLILGGMPFTKDND